jgi:MamI restriction endonuclease
VKPEVEEALGRAAQFRRELLGQLSAEDRLRLLEDLFVDFFVVQWRVLLKWAALTGQSSQVDTGYIAQHVASILLAEPGQGFRGKGLDLLDGTEVKSAAIVSGVDRPRWNHNLGTLAQDAKRVAAGKPTTSEEYLASPTVFYLLFDRVVDPDQPELPLILRVRGWCLDGQADEAWRDLVTRYADTRTPGKYNLQLHPPVGYDDDIVVNTLGNLDFAHVKVLEARIHGLGPDEEFYVEWVMRPPDQLRPTQDRSQALPYVKNARPSRLASAAEVLPDTGTLRELLPDHDVDALVRLLQIEVRIEEIEEVREDEDQSS